ncbi:MAG: hypothetical protein JRI46_00530 [Deltaproteobacteria bacterium]|nr:hypothetical protein [Deltaproteobacteria bacterium]
MKINFFIIPPPFSYSFSIRQKSAGEVPVFLIFLIIKETTSCAIGWEKALPDQISELEVGDGYMDEFNL